MYRQYCDKCGKEIISINDATSRRLYEEKLLVRTVSECTYISEGPSKVIGISECKNPVFCDDNEGTHRFLNTKGVDLCDECKLELNKIVSDFMNGTPVSAST